MNYIIIVLFLVALEGGALIALIKIVERGLTDELEKHDSDKNDRE